MDNYFYKKLKYFVFSLFFILLFFLIVTAEGLYPASGPGDTISYSINDIYNRLSTGAEGLQETWTEPSSAPVSGTSHNLNEIMAIAPSLDNSNGAGPEHVLEGKTFWGLREDQWGLLMGTMTKVCRLPL